MWDPAYGSQGTRVSQPGGFRVKRYDRIIAVSETLCFQSNRPTDRPCGVEPAPGQWEKLPCRALTDTRVDSRATRCTSPVPSTCYALLQHSASAAVLPVHPGRPGADRRIPIYRQRNADRHTPRQKRNHVAGTVINGKTGMGIVGCPLLVADEPGSWETNGGQLMADAILTAHGQTGQPNAGSFHWHTCPGNLRVVAPNGTGCHPREHLRSIPARRPG